MEQILRYGQGDPRAVRRKRSVRHHVLPKRFDKRDTRILAAAAVRAPLVLGFRLERNAEPFHAARVARLSKPNPGNADARIVAPRDEAWKQVQLTIGATNGSRIQDAFDLERIAWFRLPFVAPMVSCTCFHASSRGATIRASALPGFGLMRRATRVAWNGSALRSSLKPSTSGALTAAAARILVSRLSNRFGST